MKIITFVVVLSLISATASADVFKCKDADGHTSFQESPCTNSVSGSTKVTLPASKVNSNPSQTTSAAIAKGNNEAYNSAMANKDYNKALMFALRLSAFKVFMVDQRTPTDYFAGVQAHNNNSDHCYTPPTWYQ